MQSQLVTLGYGINADGYFGRGTQAAVMAFQQTQGLPADGIASVDTQAAPRPARRRPLSSIAVSRFDQRCSRASRRPIARSSVFSSGGSCTSNGNGSPAR